ncbi:hypothetical protein U2F26_23895 [Micromonospora sp. 4G57]|uniref:Core-binding (CB) domain-containing protein n=1 Tax=Micromonospora sicca TaxID=2202420 RepID=A0ABU5JGB7_9ACTN|nr:MULTISPECIES: hypothetical protein [unclassified Micromonospora]MDZ5445736.1 hypothetical protein [Micromonospora sp. 4G57]MDZ5491662.1 hypothetical protein [Micromonospora sp. 4G53]
MLGKLADLRRRQEQGQNLAAAPRTVGEWLDEWLRMKERDGTRPSTLQGYRKLIENHVRPAVGQLALDKLTPTVIRRLLAEKTDSGLSATTVRHIHGLIRNSLGDAEREELVHRNAARSVRPPAMRQVERRALGVDEAKRLLDVLRGHRLEALYVCALTVGLRRGELLGLAWSDIRARSRPPGQRRIGRVRRAAVRSQATGGSGHPEPCSPASGRHSGWGRRPGVVPEA